MDMSGFRDSLQFKIPAVFVLAFVVVLAAIFGVLSTVGKTMLEKQAYEQVRLAGQNIVSELGRQVALAESLATALANLGEGLPHDVQLTRTLAEHVLDREGSEAFIAGGGLWPAPFAFDPAVERRSFFWGRDSTGALRYYDDYNAPDGPGYHHEEWYVPATHLAEGEAFWSKSYMDPYSYQPMVTVTVPMYREGRFYGVSTVDLKLEGLHAFLAAASRSYGGYAFAVDRNGKFLSFPRESLTKLYGVDAQGQRTEEFVDVHALAQRQASFAPLADAIKHSIEALIARANGLTGFNPAVASALATESYQIGDNEARLIAAVLAASGTAAGFDTAPQQLFLADDLILGEAALAAVFEMPGTFWKIVTVMPYSRAVEASDAIYHSLLEHTLIALAVALLVVMLLVRRILVRPIGAMAAQLQLLTAAGECEHRQLRISDRGELGNLAMWFNRRTQRLLEVQSDLHEAHKVLEQRVAQRTEELRREIDKRKQDQAIKDAHAARVEKQHAAIVRLSLHESVSQGDVAAAARLITEIAAAVVGVRRAGVWLIDAQNRHLTAVDVYNGATASHEQGLSLAVDAHPSYFRALKNDRSIAVADISSDPRTRELKDYAATLGIVSLLDSPIRISGSFCGVVCLEHRGERRVWHDDEIRFSGEIADQFLQVLSNAERLHSEEKIRQLAFYDSLTELANRRLLHEEIHRELAVARRHALFGSLIYLDLDNFKTLNDSLGHHVGDELLVQVAQRLKRTLRQQDTAARLGGDEFVVLLRGEHTERRHAMEQALSVARKIQAATSQPYQLHGYEHVITSSMGVTLYPESDHSAADLLKQADTAMYRAKADGKNTICFYNPAMQKAADNRLRLEKQVRSAIAQQQFEMHFQPQVDQFGEPVSLEALVRWRHPDRGTVMPGEFIPVAEETGLILDLGSWILRDVCAFSRDARTGYVAINISPVQFRQPDFVSHVERIVKDTGADPHGLMIEITEGIVIENVDDTIRKMQQLKAMGIRIAIDDFGTGYSSLAYLRQLPLDQLKINDKFVRDINSDPSGTIIVETIISMARHLGLDVVAEGVETAEQARFLHQRGCHRLQGHYFSTALGRAETLRFLGDPGTRSRRAPA